MDSLARLLVFAGITLILLGAIVFLWNALFPSARLGNLPGDLRFERNGTTVYIPLATMLLASLILSALFWAIGALRR